MTSAVALALIGYGEVGQIFAQEFRAQGVSDVAVYDIVFDVPTGRERAKRALEAHVRPAISAADAARGADIVISAVTADAAAMVAMQAAHYLQPGQIFFDINSASPATKCASARHVEPVAARFVEGAVMAPVPGRGIRVPILAGGPHAKTTAQILNAMGMNVRAVSAEPGRASAMKLCRSIMIKGVEALIIDCAVAASRWDVKSEVFDSLTDTFPAIDFAVLAHGRTRSQTWSSTRCRNARSRRYDRGSWARRLVGARRGRRPRARCKIIGRPATGGRADAERLTTWPMNAKGCRAVAEKARAVMAGRSVAGYHAVWQVRDRCSGSRGSPAAPGIFQWTAAVPSGSSVGCS